MSAEGKLGAKKLRKAEADANEIVTALRVEGAQQERGALTVERRFRALVALIGEPSNDGRVIQSLWWDDSAVLWPVRDISSPPTIVAVVSKIERFGQAVVVRGAWRGELDQGRWALAIEVSPTDGVNELRGFCAIDAREAPWPGMAVVLEA